MQDQTRHRRAARYAPMQLMRALLALLFVLVALFRPAKAEETPKKAQNPNENSAVGINLSGISYYSTEIVFVDLFKHSQPWKSQVPGKPYGQGGPLDLTDDGWVQSLAGDGQFADSIILSSIADRYPRGVYTCLYDGPYCVVRIAQLRLR